MLVFVYYRYFRVIWVFTLPAGPPIQAFLSRLRFICDFSFSPMLSVRAHGVSRDLDLSCFGRYWSGLPVQAFSARLSCSYRSGVSLTARAGVFSQIQRFSIFPISWISTMLIFHFAYLLSSDFLEVFERVHFQAFGQYCRPFLLCFPATFPRWRRVRRAQIRCLYSSLFDPPCQRL